jgi:hypothetical protein
MLGLRGYIGPAMAAVCRHDAFGFVRRLGQGAVLAFARRALASPGLTTWTPARTMVSAGMIGRIAAIGARVTLERHRLAALRRFSSAFRSVRWISGAAIRWLRTVRGRSGDQSYRPSLPA